MLCRWGVFLQNAYQMLHVFWNKIDVGNKLYFRHWYFNLWYILLGDYWKISNYVSRDEQLNSRHVPSFLLRNNSVNANECSPIGVDICIKLCGKNTHFSFCIFINYRKILYLHRYIGFSSTLQKIVCRLAFIYKHNRISSNKGANSYKIESSKITD